MQSELFHLFNITVALGTGLGDQISADRRIGMFSWDNVVRIAMAVLARGRLVAILVQGLTMGALQVDFCFSIVTFSTIHFLERRIMFRFRDVAMTADALVVGVNRSLKQMPVDKWLRILLAMAFQTGGVFYINRVRRRIQPEDGKAQCEQTGDFT